MPKINLLQQATTESSGSKSSPINGQIAQLIAMVAVVVVGVAIWLGYVWYTTNLENKRVKDELAQEMRIEQELKKLKEDADNLQKRIVLVESRIKVIKQLRAEQRGPVGILSKINDYIPTGIFLDSITQRGNGMTIVGTTSVETLIATFSKDLEFSGGIFTGVDVQTEQVAATPTVEAATKFTIRCTYNPPVAAPSPDANQTASISK